MIYNRKMNESFLQFFFLGLIYDPRIDMRERVEPTCKSPIMMTRGLLKKAFDKVKGSLSHICVALVVPFKLWSES